MDLMVISASHAGRSRADVATPVPAHAGFQAITSKRSGRAEGLARSEPSHPFGSLISSSFARSAVNPHRVGSKKPHSSWIGFGIGFGSFFFLIFLRGAGGAALTDWAAATGWT